MIVMTAARTTSAVPARPGLRERKKIRTRAAIREATHALVRERGYDTTTVEQIAERAEVSPSTVLRYFPAKEDIVLPDPLGPDLSAEIRERPADEPWADALRQVLERAVLRGLAEDPGTLRLRARLVATVPAVRSRLLEALSDTGRALAEALAGRAGPDPDGLEIRVRTTALVGGLTEALLYWAERDFHDDPAALLRRALDALEPGPRGEKP
ncbi:TetR family transcriptional regulator [Streptomyces sp. NPDC000983]|uniref:TetR/AcrR family transcriptional regulator n=1 Tax=Streptomyces sp. NPDC000983 TaxID=3154373 RepID=UPI0033320C12